MLQQGEAGSDQINAACSAPGVGLAGMLLVTCSQFAATPAVRRGL
jgi:hypothetical protein